MEEYGRQIRCNQHHNIKCLKCDGVFFEIVRIGAFYMCPGCFVQEFGIKTTEFSCESELGKKYYKWMEQYKKVF